MLENLLLEDVEDISRKRGATTWYHILKLVCCNEESARLIFILYISANFIVYAFCLCILYAFYYMYALTYNFFRWKLYHKIICMKNSHGYIY